MNKNELRKQFKQVRKSIKDKKNKDNTIFNKVINNTKITESNTILLYASLNDEVDTINLIKYFLNKKIIALPKVENDIMNFYIINSIDDLKEGYYHILEPITNNKLNSFENATILVPGICFDKNGYRIGYGKGFYDKFLENKNIYSIGLCYKECLIDDTFHDNHDIKVNEIITN